ncbi:MAG TPA: selenocysteine-specific translation elongation factor, partial [Vicinamibacterales bacterium]|nr:selenocysteine-specific translation elongation factor [Vicinamibacterales bacterium]
MRSVVVGTAGHIDHGKSALVQALTGTDPDRLKEEKARGITIDLGFAHQTIDDVHFAFVDVPGHERFVKNMLAGAGGIDLVMLIVAADESVMPQTREHFDICRLLHVPAGLIALTKVDLVDADTLELARMEVRELVAGSFLDEAPMMPVSARTGEGLDALRAALVDVSRHARVRASEGVTRLPIDRVFSMKGFGTVVTGTLVSGRIESDTELIIAPGGRRVKVRGVQVHGEKQRAAVAGQRAAINLAGVEVEEIARGQTLVTPGAFEETRLADASVDLLPGAKPLKHGARVRFHQGTAETLGRVALIGPLPDDDRSPERLALQPGGRTHALQPGGRAFVRLRLEAPAILARGDRYILRAYSPPVTIAGGLILDPRPPRTAIRTAAAVERCRRLEFDPAAGDGAAADARAVAAMLEDAGVAGLSIAAMT